MQKGGQGIICPVIFSMNRTKKELSDVQYGPFLKYLKDDNITDIVLMEETSGSGIFIVEDIKFMTRMSYLRSQKSLLTIFLSMYLH